MALSRKPTSIMVVPWFNTEEWRLVKNLIFSDTSTETDKTEALRILKIWKHRTPQLPCGVEGTLILLHAILGKQIDNENNNIIQGQAIMRFLNVCVTGRSKQGDFYKSVKKMGLPRWLINLRHDVAHSSVTPSSNMLKLALSTCLEWLNKEYWLKQDETLTDDISHKKILDDVKILVQLYCKISLLQYSKSDLVYMEEVFELRPSVKDMCSRFKKMLKEHVNIRTRLSMILPKISKTFLRVDFNQLSTLICQTLIEEEALFCISITEDESGKLTIPNDFQSLWKELINWLAFNNLLFVFIKQLIHFTNNSCSEKQVIGSLWLKIFFTSILVSCNDNNEDSEKSELCLNYEYITENLWRLEKDVLTNPNKETLYYLKLFLQLCGHNEQYINNKELIVKAYTVPEGVTQETKIHTLEDVKAIVEKCGITVNDLIKQIDDVDNNEELILNSCNEKVKPKVRLATDPSVFVGYPIGILSFQVPF